MSTAPPPKPTLESIVTRYRREVSRPDTNTELEVRVQDVDCENFIAIYRALLAKTAADGVTVPVGDGELDLMVSAIMDTSAPNRHMRAMRVREIRFKDGKRSGESYVWKEPLVLPMRVSNTGGLSYAVALATERAEKPFNADEGAVVRVKARVGFPLTLTGTGTPTLQWRVDMTVTRQIMGTDVASALKQIVAQMFPSELTPKNFLSSLKLDTLSDTAAAAAVQSLYRYEVEAEFIGPSDVRDLIRPQDVTNAAEAILRMANPTYAREAAMQAEISRAASYIIRAPALRARFTNELGLKRLLPAARAITRADYRTIYPPRGMYLTDKADGKRAIAVVHDGKGVVIADIMFDYVPAKSDPTLTADTILDGEFVTHKTQSHFYAFDVIAVAGEDYTNAPFDKRLAVLSDGVAILRAAGIPATAKTYTPIVDVDVKSLEKYVRGIYEAKRPYEVDGIIITESGKPYVDTANYKWKPAEQNTIDCLVRRAPSSVLGKTPFIDEPGHKLHFLFVGIRQDMYDALGLQRCPGYSDLFGTGKGGATSPQYFPIQFSPSDAPLAYLYQHPIKSVIGDDVDGKVIEVRCTGGCLAAGSGGAHVVSWEATRIREDRQRELLSKLYFGNDFYTAELIWLNYLDPFGIDQLWNGPGLDYFMRPKAGAYRAQTGVTSFVKEQRIISLKHADWVVDIGIGKGQDLGRYLAAEIRHLVAVDQDRAALSELVRRKYNYARPEAGRTARHKSSTVIHVIAADANDPYTSTTAKFDSLGVPTGAVDALVCNLAVHYFCATAESIVNFINLARAVVKPGGQVILTVLLGDMVHALFKKGGIPDGSTWDVFESENASAAPTRKYSIRRMYTSDRLEAAGQRIGILLPFSDGAYYEEYLVNPAEITAAFVKRGFTAVAKTTVADSIPEYEARNRALAAELTPGDRAYLTLYGELVFRKTT